MIKAALDHGEIPKNIKAIPKSKLMRELKSLSELFGPIEKIMTGIKNKRTIEFLTGTGHGQLYASALSIWQQQPFLGFGLKSFRVKWRTFNC